MKTEDMPMMDDNEEEPKPMSADDMSGDSPDPDNDGDSKELDKDALDSIVADMSTAELEYLQGIINNKLKGSRTTSKEPIDFNGLD